MKRVVLVLAIVATIVPGMVYASNGSQEEPKDLCLVYGEGCPNARDSITDILTKLQAEIGKGEKIYTPGEIVVLERKLKEYSEYYSLLAYE